MITCPQGPATTVGKLKELLQVHGVATEQHLIFAHEQLRPERTLDEYGVADGDTIHVLELHEEVKAAALAAYQKHGNGDLYVTSQGRLIFCQGPKKMSTSKQHIKNSIRSEGNVVQLRVETEKNRKKGFMDFSFPKGVDDRQRIWRALMIKEKAPPPPPDGQRKPNIADLDRTAEATKEKLKELNTFKASIIKKNPELKLLHQQLVQANLVTEKEFWSHPIRAQMLNDEKNLPQNQAQARPSCPDISTGGGNNDPIQELMLNDRIEINPTVMHNIFVHSPYVEAAHRHLVPRKLSQNQFWTEFFEDQKAIRQGGHPSDLFQRFRDAEHNKHKTLTKPNADREINLGDAFSDYTTTGDTVIFDQSKHTGGFMFRDTTSKFNRHGQLVVSAVSGSSHAEATGATEEQLEKENEYQSELSGTLTLPLEVPMEEEYNDLDLMTNATLPEEDALARDVKSAGRAGYEAAIKGLKEDLNLGWQGAVKINPSHITSSPKVALRTLEKLTSEARKSYRVAREGATDTAARSNNALMVFTEGKKDALTPEFRETLKQLSNKCFELFRHYYACFPLTTRSRKKLKRLESALTKANEDLLLLRRKWCRGGSDGILFATTKPLAESLDVIFERYDKMKASEPHYAHEGGPSKRARYIN